MATAQQTQIDSVSGTLRKVGHFAAVQAVPFTVKVTLYPSMFHSVSWCSGMIWPVTHYCRERVLYCKNCVFFYLPLYTTHPQWSVSDCSCKRSILTKPTAVFLLQYVLFSAFPPLHPPSTVSQPNHPPNEGRRQPRTMAWCDTNPGEMGSVSIHPSLHEGRDFWLRSEVCILPHPPSTPPPPTPPKFHILTAMTRKPSIRNTFSAR